MMRMEQKQKVRSFSEFLISIYEAANGRLDQSALAPIEDATGKSSSHKLNPVAAKAYNDMVAAAKAAGIEWGITDSYRPYEIQDRIFDWDRYNSTGKRVKKGTNVPAAYPGTSNHGWGSAVDIKVKYGDSAHTWLTQNAAKFGFSNPFSNPRTEPWHWEHLASAGKSDGVPSSSGGGSTVIPKKIVIDSDMVSRLIAKLKEKNFSQDDLKKFATKTSITPGKGERFSGGSKISTENMKIIQDVMDKYGITNKFARAAILGVISKESSGAASEYGYQKTASSQIRKIFGSRFSSMSDAEIDALKADPEKFFNYVYGTLPGLGNTEPGDGYRYRGRGFNGITGRANYQSLQDLYNKLGGGAVDIVKNPEALEKPEVAAEFAILYFIKSFGKHFKMDAVQKMNGYEDVDTAVRDFVQANHGWGNSLSGYIGSIGLSKATDYANTLLASSSTASKTA